ncbi:PAS domain-containing protein [Desulfosporosinus hippei]|uniref:histidine kinase n=1 Tax=Desulfosporosinus hippei DSM 8344 TaxID=1121419 RepID=A0A1G8BW28_9FIRM|nr:PAS domain-containing protein [Desulfosporosinus hippei]SDH37328.1 PAS domain S-box-containing protein [Desulfosporosinus hippei DSM 8344]
MCNEGLSNEHYKKILSITPELLCISDMHGQFRYVNSAFEEVLGYTAEELRGSTLYSILHPEDKEAATNSIKSLLINKQDRLSIERRYLCKEGIYKWIAWEITIDWTEELVYSSGRNITDKKKTEEAERKAKERLEEAQEFAKLGYWEFNTITGENYWSDELIRICGLTRDEFAPNFDAFMQMVHPDDKNLIINTMKEPLKGKEYELELRLIRSDNETIWLSERVKYDQDPSGKVVRWYGVVQDISLRKLNEIKLKESETKFKELVENLREVIWIRQGGNLVYISPAYEQVWGRTCQSLYENPQSFIDSIHPEDKERILQAFINDHDINQDLFEDQYRIRRPDGTERWIWLRKFPIFDNHGKLIRHVGICYDVTKIKEYEEEVLKNKMEKEMARLERLSLVGEMAAGIGHEVRNPMTTVRGFLQLLSSKEDCFKYNEFFKLMIDELDRANSIITEFLSLAKDRVVELEVQSLKEIVQDIFPLIQADGLVSEKNIVMDLEEVAKIPLDKKEILQLILNLVQNGSQAMLPGGTIKIRTFMDNEEIVLAVSDEGSGIPPQVLEKIGTPFFTTKENGTGLGLAVCYSIVARHNAKIDIDTGSKGTTFFVRFKNLT